MSFYKLLIAFFICQIGFAQEYILSSGLKESTNISAHMGFYEDTSGYQSFEDIKKRSFKKNEKDHYILPFSDKVFWAKITLKNEHKSNSDWVLQWDNPLIEAITLFEADMPNAKEIILNYQKEDSRKIISKEPAFGFRLELGEQKTFYLKIKARRGQFASIFITPRAEFNTDLRSSTKSISFINGLLVFRLLLVLTLGFFIIKDRGLKAYSLVVLAKTAGFWAINNLFASNFLSKPENILSLDAVAQTSSPVWMAIFVLAVLPFKEMPKWMKSTMIGVLIIALLLQVYLAIDYDWYSLKIATAYIVLTCSIIFLLYAYAVIKHLDVNYYYSIPFLLGAFSYALMNARVLQLLHFKGIFAIASFFFLAEILALIFFLGRIFRATEGRKLMAERKLENEKERASKLKELDQLKTSFFANISHELKTPLTLISSPIAELTKKYPKERLLEMTARNVRKLQDLVLQLLDIQKLEEGKGKTQLQKIDVAKHLRLLVESFDSLADSKGISFSYHENNGLVQGYTDLDKLDKIVNNLLSNAFKFTPDNGSILVKTVFSEDLSKLVLKVTDSGIGIEEKDLQDIFNRFHQVNNERYIGSGIGLALAKELVELLHGKLSVESEINKGSTFTMELPLKLAHLPEADLVVEKPEELTLELVQGKEVLLLVEDNVDMNDYLKMLFEEHFEVIQASNGAEGLEMASLHVPDIVICDLMMPVMDGFEFSRIIRSKPATSHVPLLLLTANDAKESKLKGLGLGIDHYLIKPFDAEELKGVVFNTLENRKTLRKTFAEGIIDLKPTEIKIDPLEKDFVSSLLSFLEDNFGNSGLKIDELAQAHDLSETQFRRKLKNITGFSPKEFLRKFRLEKASILLLSNQKTVSEVCFEVGFENLSHFSKIFQMEFGKSPKEHSVKA